MAPGPVALLTQSTHGTLLGTVKDATGAVVPGASVVVTEVATNISKTGAANERGEFETPNRGLAERWVVFRLYCSVGR